MQGEMEEVHFVFCVHNHQPVGNFDHVIEEAYQRAYRPFLERMAAHPSVKFAIHTSGCLWEWVEAAHPEYVEMLKAMADRGQAEILTGGFYEPILAMIPDEDKVAQISLYSRHLERRLGVSPKGLWLAERVWEPQLAGWLRKAGVEYTALDDFHFRAVGLHQDSLTSHFFTEDQGQTIQVFPLSEVLRYLIPFQPVEKTRDYLRSLAVGHPGGVVVFGDDGEKFGVWPGTFRAVYEDGWLEAFLRMLEENRPWLHTLTFSEWLSGHETAGLVYLPTISYPEMMEWALPADRWGEYRENRAVLKDRFRYPWSPPFLRGGYWRNFLSKYPESYRMYRKMLHVRGRLSAADPGRSRRDLEAAWRDLWRAQCNCAYWHGVFGGLYLKHLRSEVYRRVLNAEVLLDRSLHGETSWVECETEDFDGDGEEEVLLSTADLNVYVSPARGGSIFELDFKPARANLAATLARRPEGYHEDILGVARAPAEGKSEETVTIHDRVAVKEHGLEAYLVYDRDSGGSWTERFVLPSATVTDLKENQHRELGDFIDAPYEVRNITVAGSAELVLGRRGTVQTASGIRRVDLTKRLTLEPSGRMTLGYELECVDGKAQGLGFGAIFNLAASAGSSPECYYLVNGARPGEDLLDSEASAECVRSVALVDRILSAQVDFRFDRPARLLRFPVMTVSQSEVGFEKMYQSSVILPLWEIRLGRGERWEVRIGVTVSIPGAVDDRARIAGAAPEA